MDVALAALRLPAVRAVPVSVRIATERWKGWAAYERLSYLLARGGPDHNPARPRELLDGVNALMPLAMARDATRSRDARRANSAPEQRVADRVTLFWEVPAAVSCMACNGFTVEATNSILAVEARLQTRAIVHAHCWCKGLPPHYYHRLARLVQPKAGSGDEAVRDVAPPARRRSVWVSHAPVPLLSTFPFVGPVRVTARPYVVTRCMVEVDRIPPAWVRRINGPEVDEVWVPAAFLVDAFYKSGVRPDRRVFVVPDGIDVHEFDPATVAPAAVIAGDARYRGYYKFFSNFKMDVSKGWDLLYQAYFTTFKKSDRVVLYIKTYLWDSGVLAQWHNSTLGERNVREYVANVIGVPPGEMAAFVILAQAMPADEIRALYAASDCFVLPTKGEGWGLPLQEAMAMGLPTIGTNWGGNIQFMNATNSLLIDIEGLEDPQKGGAFDPRNDTARLTPLRAKPSWRHTAELMRWAHTHQAAARAIGAVAREHIVRYFSLEAHAQAVLDRVVDIDRLLEQRG
jgi:glycosyltransferase involved in cell wall biosynthesis